MFHIEWGVGQQVRNVRCYIPHLWKKFYARRPLHPSRVSMYSLGSAERAPAMCSL